MAIRRLRKDPLIPSSRQALLQAHFVEYQAMVARISRFISLQLIVWPVLVAFLTLTATGFKNDVLTQFQFIWVSVIASQIIVAAYYFALYEVYSHIRYIECELRPKVAMLLRSESFWLYEKYLGRKGKSFSPLIGDIFFPLAMSLIAILLPIWWKWSQYWSRWDVFLCCLNVIAFAWLASVARRVVIVRKEFERAA